MRWLFALLCVGCGPSECVVYTTAIESGSATFDTWAVHEVAWAEASAPSVTQHVSFELTGTPGIECNGIPWSALEHGVVVDVSEYCNEYYDKPGPLANVTLSVTSTLDDNDEGTVTLHIDMPKQEVNDRWTMEVDALVVAVKFAHAACGGSSWGFWDI